MNDQEAEFFEIAFQEAQQAALKDDVPVGAVIVLEGQIIARSGNRVERNHDPTAHAEILVIREASALLKTPRLVGCDLYVTLEPCAMCAQAMAHARIRCLYYGAYDAKGGGVDHGSQVFSQKTCHHRPKVVGGFREQECGQLLKTFFQARRKERVDRHPREGWSKAFKKMAEWGDDQLLDEEITLKETEDSEGEWSI